MSANAPPAVCSNERLIRVPPTTDDFVLGVDDGLLNDRQLEMVDLDTVDSSGIRCRVVGGVGVGT
jgi:hypothetical protein